MPTVVIEKEYDCEELMDSVFYNIWSASSPWVVEYGYGGYAEDKVVPITYYDGDNKKVSKSISPDDLARGLGVVLTKRYRHCGESVSPDLGDWDACVSDMVLQAACMGEVIYG